MVLGKISNIGMYLFIEKGLRRRISNICKRYSKANNKYVKIYDPTKLSKFILDLDMNNLYRWGLSQYLPYGGFKWLKNVNDFNVNSISEKNSIGYILEVVLEHLNQLHRLHNDCWLAPEKTCNFLWHAVRLL